MGDDGGLLHIFGSAGQGEGELNGPMGIAVAGEYVYVADTGNHRIQVFLKKTVGCFVPSSIIGSKGGDDGQLLSPPSLTIDGDHLHVADEGNSCIHVFNRHDGSFIRKFGHEHLQKPSGIRTGGPYVYVVDSGKDCMFVYDKADGSFIRTVGTRGGQSGELLEPSCLAVQGSNIYITE